MDIETYAKNFNTYLYRLGYAQSTIHHTTNDIKTFLSHLKAQNIKNLTEVKPKHIHSYNDYLHGLKSRITHVGLNGKTIQSKINNVRLFSQFTEMLQLIKKWLSQLKATLLFAMTIQSFS